MQKNKTSPRYLGKVRTMETMMTIGFRAWMASNRVPASKAIGKKKRPHTDRSQKIASVRPVQAE